jgi:hypothetical protein
MVQLCHSNDFGSLWLCSQFAIRVLALRFGFQPEILVLQVSSKECSRLTCQQMQLLKAVYLSRDLSTVTMPLYCKRDTP